MSSFAVLTPTLAAAAVAIEATGAYVGSAGAAASSGQQGAFGAEPIGDAFAGMCVRAQQATAELQQTIGMLSRNVAAAAAGYLVTDRGIVAMSELRGFTP
jgi:hypothetical protein